MPVHSQTEKKENVVKSVRGFLGWTSASPARGDVSGMCLGYALDVSGAELGRQA